MESDFLKRIRINQSGTIRDKKQAMLHAQQSNTVEGLGGEPKPISIDDIEIGLTETITNNEREDLELSPRETVLRMLVDCKLDEQYKFKTTKGGGEHYVQAVRQVLSRTRKKALKQKRRLDEFKLLTVSIKQNEDHDEVILVRSKQMSAHEASVYDTLIDAFERK